MSDVTDEMIERAGFAVQEAYRANPYAKMPEILRVALAALSGTREAVEPVAWVDSHVVQLLQSQRGQDFQIRYRVLYGRPFDGAAPLYAAPPSDPIEHGAVTVKPLEWEERSGSLYANTAMGEACIDEHYDGFSVIENGRLHEGFASQEAAQAFLQEKHDAWVSDWLEPAALSPAPEAGSDEVERLRRDLERKHEAYCIAHDQAMENGTALRNAVARENALRDQLGKMREMNTALRAVYDRWVNYCPFDDDSDEDNDLRDQIDATLAETQEAGR